MGHVIYYVPDERIIDERKGRLDPLILEQRGLLYAFRERSIIPDQTMYYRDNGPAGKGVILFPKPVGDYGDLPTLKFDEDRQQWFNAVDYWIGFISTEETLTSEYFQLRTQTAGYPVRDAYDDEWLIPVICSPDPTRYCLQTEYSLGFKGEFTRRRKREDEYLWQLAGRCRDYLHMGDMSEEEIAKAVVTFLGVNYYVSVPEVALLERLGRNILQSDFCAAVIAAVNDFQLEQDVDQKKRTTGPMSSSPGRSADIQDTDRVEEHSA